MPFNSNIYRVDWQKLVRLLLPIKMRRNPLLRFGYACIMPLQWLYNQFLMFKKNLEYQLKINGQIPFLEKALNDRYDFTLRRIYIVDAREYNPLPLYLKIENKPLVLWLKSEKNPLVLYTKGETAIYTVDFIVMVPTGLAYNPVEMRAFIDGYKLLSKTYQIQLF